jgi:hypothetical protein
MHRNRLKAAEGFIFIFWPTCDIIGVPSTSTFPGIIEA